MNEVLLRKMKALIRMHDEYRNEQKILSDLKEKKEKAVVPQAPDYIKRRFVERPSPVPPTTPTLTAEEYADKRLFLRKHTVHYTVRKDEPEFIVHFILVAIVLALGLFAYVDQKEWMLAETVADGDSLIGIILGLLLTSLELISALALIPAAIIFAIYVIILLVKSAKLRGKSKKSYREAIKQYRNLREKYEAYRYNLSVYQKNKQEYDLNKERQIRTLGEEYRKKLPEIQEGVRQENIRLDREIAESDGRLLTLEDRIGKASREIGLAEQDVFRFSYVSDLEKLVSEGRADSMVDAKNLLVCERREEERLGYAKRQAEAAEKAARDQEEARRQQRLWQIQQEEEERKREEERRQEEEAWRQEQRDREEAVRREREKQEADYRNAEERRGREQCNRCRNYLHCNYRYNNNGSCAGFTPRPSDL